MKKILDIFDVVPGWLYAMALAMLSLYALNQHMCGMAADFTAPFFGTPLQVARAIVASKITFDQLIQEGTWVHISFSAKPRRSVLTAKFTNGVASYSPGLV